MPSGDMACLRQEVRHTAANESSKAPANPGLLTMETRFAPRMNHMRQQLKVA